MIANREINVSNSLIYYLIFFIEYIECFRIVFIAFSLMQKETGEKVIFRFDIKIFGL
jgi:hypothetical protein